MRVDRVVGIARMKYMGSKRAMLTNGLGESLDTEIRRAKRFVDLFLGTAEVATYVARRHSVPVFGADLQAYSVVLAEAVISRCNPLAWSTVWDAWFVRASLIAKASSPPLTKLKGRLTRREVQDIRHWCEEQSDLPITRAYGGHYFSAEQSVWIDAFRATLPNEPASRSVALAALIQSASQCVASPGHTAQPFQPTRTAAPFLKGAWLRDVGSRVQTCGKTIASQFARIGGAARIADANELAGSLTAGDLVFLDPPYSGVQYSRFYHVLESVARGTCGEVSGVGRYPNLEHRPKSKFSLVTQSEEAMDQLLFLVSVTGASAILTFPDHQCSNGLSGDTVREIARAHFRVRESVIQSRFSTLGGRGSGEKKVAKRMARHEASELMLLLRPRSDQLL
jgi:hypothetical protein